MIENKDPKSELYTFLLHYRATPHGTTGVSPAEMLFGRRLQTKLPQVYVKEESRERKEIRERHDKKRLDQKKYFDKRHKAHDKKVTFGDQVLVKQKKSTTKPPYDHRPYTVTEVNGNKVEMKRADGSKRVRDKNQIKVLKERPLALEPSWGSKDNATADYESFEIEGNIEGLTFTNEVEASIPEAEIEDPAIFEPGNSASDSDDEQEEGGLFDLNEEAEDRMRLLLEAASNAADQSEDNRRVTRSRGVQLHWNPNMNDKDVLLNSEDE